MCRLNVKVDGVNSVPGSSPLKAALSRVPTMIIGMLLIPNTSHRLREVIFRNRCES